VQVAAVDDGGEESTPFETVSELGAEFVGEVDEQKERGRGGLDEPELGEEPDGTRDGVKVGPVQGVLPEVGEDFREGV
jgi:hypothetical protein